LGWIGSRVVRGMESGRRFSIFVCFTMSTRFSAHDFDDHPRPTLKSFVDLSPSSHTPRSHAAPASVGSELEGPTVPHTQRSSIRINTDLSVRIYTSNILFQQLFINLLPSLAPTRKVALAYDTQARLAAFYICAIIPRTFYFHLCSRDSCRHKSAWKARLLGSAPGPSPDDKLSASARASRACKKVKKVDPVVRRDALPAICYAPIAPRETFR